MRKTMMLLVVCACVAVAATESQIWKDLRSRYLGLKTLSGTFRETICVDTQGTCTEFEGAFAISLPNQYRIEVTEGMKQLFVCDGTTLWIYLPVQPKLMKRPAGGFAPVMAFLEPITDSTAKVEVSKDKSGIYVVKVLTEDEMAAMTDVVLELDKAGTQINGFSFKDGMGQKIHFSFYDQNWNPELSPTLFSFTPPEGVEVEE